MIIGQKKPLLPLCLHQGFDLQSVELDDLLLLAMDPADEHNKEELPGLQDEAHGLRDGGTRLNRMHHPTIAPLPQWSESDPGERDPARPSGCACGIACAAWRCD